MRHEWLENHKQRQKNSMLLGPTACRHPTRSLLRFKLKPASSKPLPSFSPLTLGWLCLVCLQDNVEEQGELRGVLQEGLKEA